MANVVSDRTGLLERNREMLLKWLRGYGGPPVAADWVPGASAEERRRLAALGGVVRELTGAGRSDVRTISGGGWATAELKEWISSGPEPPKSVLDAARGLLELAGEEGLADVYASAVSGRSRRRLGTFFTRPSEVRWMIRSWRKLRHSPASIVDVGAGVGIFTIAAARSWPHSHVHAVDINPVTLGLLAWRAGDLVPVRESASAAPGVRLVLDDFVEWLTLQWTSIPSPRLVLGNPPYTRLQLLPRADRDRLAVAAGELCGRRASLSALITASVLRRLDDPDGLCLLLPAQWLESDYAAGLRRWLWAARRRRVELHLFESDTFSDAQVDAVSLLVGPVRRVNQPFAVSTDGKPATRRLDRSEDCPDQWRHLFRPSDWPPTSRILRTGRPLSAFATVKRGVATGANRFFVVSHRQIEKFDLPMEALRPVIQRLRDFENGAITESSWSSIPLEKKRWLLVAGEQYHDDQGVRRYVRFGEGEDYQVGHLCATRRNWFDLSSEVSVPDVIVGPAAKDGFRFLANSLEGVVTNNLYSMRWRAEIGDNRRREILDWLTGDEGQESLRRVARTRGGGFLKIEPRALNAIVIPQ